jgi:hypothetical protein
MKFIGTTTSTQPPLGFGYVPLWKRDSTQLATAAFPKPFLPIDAEQAEPVGLTRMPTSSLPASALSFDRAFS